MKTIPNNDLIKVGALDGTDTRVLEMFSHGATGDVVASELSITEGDVMQRVQHVVDTVSQLSSRWKVLPDSAVRVPGFDEVSRSVTALLEAARGDREQVVALLRETTRAVEVRRKRPDSMTQAQADFLVRSGSMTLEQLKENEAAVARGELAEAERQSELEPILESVGSEEAGRILGIEGSSVRHRKDKGTLYAFKADQALRYPTWQFVDHRDPKRRTLPGLSVLVKAIPSTMHPASVLGFMTTPQDDLLVEDEAVTPVEWLSGGGDPQEVVDLLKERDRP